MAMSHTTSPSDWGLVYVAFGYEYLLMAAYSAYTARLHNPDLKCSVVTNLRVKEGSALNVYFDAVHHVDMGHAKNRDIKTRACDFAPFARAAFVDCDTEIGGSLAPMFLCLDRFEIILKLNTWPTDKDYMIDEGLHGGEFPFWNSGVIFFRRCDAARQFFAEWQRYFKEYGRRSDQPALARAVYENPDIRYLSVGCMWNTFPQDLTSLVRDGSTVKSRIWHYRDVKDFPELASRIMAHHDTVIGAVDTTDAAMEKEVDGIVRRYRVLGSWWYRNRIIRCFAVPWLARLNRRGYLTRWTLVRTRYREGGQFPSIKSGCSHDRGAT